MRSSGFGTSNNIFLTGLPEKLALAFLSKLPGKASNTRLENFASQRLVMPGIKFCSWITNGLPIRREVRPPGPATKPPIPSTTQGLRRLITRIAWNMACNNLNGIINLDNKPLPLKPLISIHSISMPCSGTTRDSKLSRVPNQKTDQPRLRSSSATANAGKTCPPVPPAITITLPAMTFSPYRHQADGFRSQCASAASVPGRKQ